MRPGRVVALVTLVAAAALGATAVALAVSTTGNNATLSELRHRGVEVRVVITGCVASSSGIGMSVEYWTCRGSYTFGGRRFDEVVRGERALVERGRAMAAVAVPGRPSLLYTPAALHQVPQGYALAEGLGAAAVVLTVGGIAAGRAGRRS